jgi:hypothetical protein
MTLPLTPEMVESAYEFLKTTPPFNRWKLVPADEVAFHVTSARDYMGRYDFDGKSHSISISMRMVGHTDTLFRTLAHEVVHMRQVLRGIRPAVLPHNGEFKKMTARIAKYHGFDPKEL